MKHSKLHETPETTTEMTSPQLASFYALSRERMEHELVRLGLRDPSHDGATLYPVAEVARRFDEEDHARLAAAGEALVGFTENAALAARIVEGIVAEETERWIAETGLYEGIVALKKNLLIRLQKTNRVQAAKRLGDSAAELAALQDFGAALLGAINERRQPAQAKTEEDSDV